jgi:Ala-tRNA(Pro) deacylase
MLPKAETIEEARKRLFQRFSELHIVAVTVSYPAHSTVEEGKQLRGAMTGTFTKNLLRRDKKNKPFLFSIHEDRVLDLKTLLSAGIGRRQRDNAGARGAPGCLRAL